MVDFAKEPPFWLVSILQLCNPLMKLPYRRNKANNRLFGYDMVSLRFVFSEVAALKGSRLSPKRLVWLAAEDQASISSDIQPSVAGSKEYIFPVDDAWTGYAQVDDAESEVNWPTQCKFVKR